MFFVFCKIKNHIIFVYTFLKGEKILVKPNSKRRVKNFVAVVIYIILCMFSCHWGKASKFFLDPSAIVPAFGSFITNKFGAGPSVRGIGYFILFTVIFAIALYLIKVDDEGIDHDATGHESGSAKWNKNIKGYNRIYTDPKDSPNSDGDYNMILTDQVFLSMNTRQTRRNNNVMVVGGSGAGKSRFFVKPNLLQANCSYVITDPAGELLETQAGFLEREGYKIKCFNLVEMKHSNCYNPFNYIRDDLGVLILINCLIKNTNPDGKSGGDPFWEKSETALLQALMFYLIKYRPKEEQNFTSIMKLLRAAEVDENNPNVKSPLDRIFDEVAKRDSNSIALKQYMTFKMGAGKTLKSILISCSVRLTVFNMKEIENLTGTDDIDLGSIGDEKQALFIVIPAADSTYNFLVSMMYSQLFETLYFHAETQCKGKRLNYHVRFMLDEFANIGQIPEFTKKLATMRKYEISCSIILQNLAQIKAMYKDDWEGLIGNCDSFLFLGGQEYSTLEYLSKELGKTTVHVYTHSRSFARKGGSGNKGQQKTARELMTPDEIMKMDNRDCILIIRGLHPFYGPKYDYPRHKNYKYTGDYADSQLYDYRKKFNNEIKANIESIGIGDKSKSSKEGLTSKRIEKVIVHYNNPLELCNSLGVNEETNLEKLFKPVLKGARIVKLKKSNKQSKNTVFNDSRPKQQQVEGAGINKMA